MNRQAFLMSIGALIGLAACAPQTLPDHPGAVAAIESYYRDHAWEDGARCVMPEMDVTRADLIQDQDDRLVVKTRYYWEDERHQNVGGSNICQGFATRTFTLQGGRVIGMSGTQRP